MEVSFLPVDPAVDSLVSKSLLLMLQISLLFFRTLLSGGSCFYHYFFETKDFWFSDAHELMLIHWLRSVLCDLFDSRPSNLDRLQVTVGEVS